MARLATFSNLKGSLPIHPPHKYIRFMKTPHNLIQLKHTKKWSDQPPFWNRGGAGLHIPPTNNSG